MFTLCPRCHAYTRVAGNVPAGEHDYCDRCGALVPVHFWEQTTMNSYITAGVSVMVLVLAFYAGKHLARKAGLT